MNKVYKSVWNESLGAWVAVSEQGPARGKRSGRVAKVTVAALFALGAAQGALAEVALDGGVVVSNGSGLDNGVAIASGSNANSDYGVALGAAATAAGVGDVAIGASVITSSGAPTGDGGILGATAVGSNAKAQGASTTAFGGRAVASADQATSIGAHSSASGLSGVAAGYSSNAAGDNSVSIGYSTSALGGGDIVVGSQSSANGNGVNAIVVGVHSSATGENAISIGDKTITSADRAEAFGAHATSSATDSLAIGYGATATQSNSVALGAGSVASAPNTVSVGNASQQRTITFVQAGNLSASSTDAVNGSQLFATNASVAALTNQINGFQTGSKYLAANDAAGSTDGASATGIGSLALGGNAVADSTGGSDAAVAIGSDSRATVARSMAIGPGATTTATNSISIGTLSIADRANTVSVGTTSAQRQIVNVAAGTQDNDVANIAQLKSTGLKLDANGNATNALVAYDDTTLGTVTLGGGAAGTTITNLKAGTVSAESTDAVNGSQLYTTNANLAALSADAVKYDTAAHDIITFGNAGTPVKLTNVKDAKLNSTSSDAVTGAQLYATNVNVAKNTTDISNLSSSFDSLTGDINNGQIGIVRQDLSTRIITIGGATDGTTINVAGTNGSRVVTGVANGAVSAKSTDAINGSQLFNASSTIAAALGGGASVDSKSGGVTAPTYNVGGTQVHDVGSAIDNLDGRVTKNTTDIASLQGNLANVSDVASNAVAYDSKDHTKVTLGGATPADGTAPDAVQLTNVKAGDLSDTSTDAVNGSQLAATNAKLDAYAGVVDHFQGSGVDYVAVNSSNQPLPVATGANAVAIGANSTASGNNSVALGANSVADQDNTVSVGSAGSERRITNVAAGTSGTDAANVNQLNSLRNDLGASMTSLQRSAFAGVAAAMAMPNLTPRENGKTVVAAGVGNYKGYSAFGAGATYRSRDGAWLVNGALSVTPHGDTGVRAQVGYEF